MGTYEQYPGNGETPVGGYVSPGGSMAEQMERQQTFDREQRRQEQEQYDAQERQLASEAESRRSEAATRRSKEQQAAAKQQQKTGTQVPQKKSTGARQSTSNTSRSQINAFAVVLGGIVSWLYIESGAQEFHPFLVALGTFLASVIAIHTLIVAVRVAVYVLKKAVVVFAWVGGLLILGEFMGWDLAAELNRFLQ